MAPPAGGEAAKRFATQAGVAKMSLSGPAAMKPSHSARGRRLTDARNGRTGPPYGMLTRAEAGNSLIQINPRERFAESSRSRETLISLGVLRKSGLSLPV